MLSGFVMTEASLSKSLQEYIHPAVGAMYAYAKALALFPSSSLQVIPLNDHPWGSDDWRRLGFYRSCYEPQR